MNKLNRYGQMRLEFLRTCRPELLQRYEGSGTLFDHLLTSQRHIAWELEQLLFAGLDEETAERYVIEEYIRNPEIS
jgi:hypothetical protein